MRAGLAFIVCWMLAGGSATAQSYQGGVRGSISDADGVVPGVDVTLTNEQTNVARSTLHQRAAASTASRLWILEPTASGRCSRGSRPSIDRAFGIGTQEFLVIDLTLEVGDCRTDGDGDGPRADDRSRHRVAGSRPRRRRASGAARRRTARRSRSARRCRRSFSRAARSSPGSRISPAPRGSRSAAAWCA